MTTYRWAHGKPLRRHSTGEKITRGQKFDPTESELKHFSDRIEVVKDEETDVDEDSDAGEDDLDERAVALADESYQTVVAAVKDGDADEFLDDLKAVDDRGSVQEAITERSKELDD